MLTLNTAKISCFVLLFKVIQAVNEPQGLKFQLLYEFGSQSQLWHQVSWSPFHLHSSGQNIFQESLEEEGLAWVTVPEVSPCWSGAGGLLAGSLAVQQELVMQFADILADQEAGTRAEVGRLTVTHKDLCHSDMHPLAQPQDPKVPQLRQTALPVGDSMLKHIHLWGHLSFGHNQITETNWDNPEKAGSGSWCIPSIKCVWHWSAEGGGRTDVDRIWTGRRVMSRDADLKTPGLDSRHQRTCGWRLHDLLKNNTRTGLGRWECSWFLV